MAKAYCLDYVKWIYDEKGTFVYPHIVDTIGKKVVNILTGETFDVENAYYAGHVMNAVINGNETAKNLGIRDCDWHYTSTQGLMLKFKKLRPLSVKVAFALGGYEFGKSEIDAICDGVASIDKIQQMADKLPMAIQYEKEREAKTRQERSERERKRNEKYKKIDKIINSKHSGRDEM